KHSLALGNDGTVWAWGDNTSGQLGDGTTTPRLSPVQVPGLGPAVAIASGQDHSLAVLQDGTVWAWGASSWGQLGDGTTTPHPSPVRVSALTDVVAVAAAGHHSVALRRDGTVWGWGKNFHGQLGMGATSQTAVSTPVQVAGLADVSAVAAGDSHTLAVSTGGAVRAWGASNWGQLGHGVAFYQPVPIRVLPPFSGP
ncbi:MAG TPA: RCC1 repeat-containing protein, partial [Myxococcaceae bacterium]